LRWLLRKNLLLRQRCVSHAELSELSERQLQLTRLKAR
jgi:hypothetical protein